MCERNLSNGLSSWHCRRCTYPASTCQVDAGRLDVDDSNAIGSRVRDNRKLRGLTQQELARLSGLSVSLVRKLEQGEYGGIRLETVHKLAIALKVHTSALAVGRRRLAGHAGAGRRGQPDVLRAGASGTPS